MNGASILCGGLPIESKGEYNSFMPTILEGVNNSAQIRFNNSINLPIFSTFAYNQIEEVLADKINLNKHSVVQLISEDINLCRRILQQVRF